MFAVTVSWIAISIIFLSFGDFFVFLYNKLCRQNEQYGLTDTFLLGMCFALIPLSVSSLWLPSNQYILFVFLTLSIIYWFLNKDRFYSYSKKIKTALSRYSPLQLIAFIIPVVSLLIVIQWQVGVFDSLFYHQQNIRWNEEYAVVPGLGNLEHRFGFNSNYLLLSAIFSFRFIFGEAVYSLQALVLIYVLCWIIKEIIDSGYEIKRAFLLVVVTAYFLTFGYTYTATSTDAIPNLIAFYLIAKLLLYPENLKKKYLLFIFVPIGLITFKLSIIALCTISIFAFILLIKAKSYRTIIFLFICSSLIVSVWCLRNVIISGYLVFPLYAIDLFNVDWKIPLNVAIEEEDFIYSCGLREFRSMIWTIKNISPNLAHFKNWFVYSLVALATVSSPFIVIYAYFRKSYLNKTIYVVYLTLVLMLAIWFIGGPDPRFAGGILFAMVYFVIHIAITRKREILLSKLGIIVLIIFSCNMIYWPIGRTHRFYDMFNLSVKKVGVRPARSILYQQYSYRELLKSRYAYIDEFPTYKLNNDITIYTSNSPEVPKGKFVCFDSPFPCTVLRRYDPMKYQDLNEIEARGTSLENGFRAKNK